MTPMSKSKEAAIYFHIIKAYYRHRHNGAAMRIILFSILICLASCASHQNNQPPESSRPPVVTAAREDEPLNLNFCELLGSPEKYEQKLVRVKVLYCYCFEDSKLYSSKCAVQKSVWVQGSFNKCSNAGRIDDFQSPGKDEPSFPRWGAHTVGIVAVGKLVGIKGGYGQMNRFDYLFDIKCLERAELFDLKGRDPAAMPKKQQLQVEEFENSN
jgi:hypothetical protein